MSSDTSTSPIDTTPRTFDILVAGEKKGEAFNINPVVIESDTQCKEYLENLLKSLTLTAEESTFLTKCISVLTSENGQEVDFGPADIITFAVLAEKYSEKSTEIMACSQYLTESIDCYCDMPPNIFLLAANAHAGLADLLVPASESRTDDDEDEDEDDEMIGLFTNALRMGSVVLDNDIEDKFAELLISASKAASIDDNVSEDTSKAE